MGIVFETSTWSDALWSGHCKASASARQALSVGSGKQPQFREFATDMHAALYLRHEPKRHGQAPEWATHLLAQAHDLAEWKGLRARCERNGFAAGIACETLLQTLLPLLPEAPKPSQRQPRRRGQHDTPEAGQAPGQREATQPASEDASTVRRARIAAGTGAL